MSNKERGGHARPTTWKDLPRSLCFRRNMLLNNHLVDDPTMEVRYWSEVASTALARSVCCNAKTRARNMSVACGLPSVFVS